MPLSPLAVFFEDINHIPMILFIAVESANVLFGNFSSLNLLNYDQGHGEIRFNFITAENAERRRKNRARILIQRFCFSNVCI
jgi:hypothetical protein